MLLKVYKRPWRNYFRYSFWIWICWCVFAVFAVVHFEGDCPIQNSLRCVAHTITTAWRLAWPSQYFEEPHALSWTEQQSSAVISPAKNHCSHFNWFWKACAMCTHVFEFRTWTTTAGQDKILIVVVGIIIIIIFATITVTHWLIVVNFENEKRMLCRMNENKCVHMMFGMWNDRSAVGSAKVSRP